MDVPNWIVVLVGGVVGWALVSLVAHLVRQQKQPPLDLYGGLAKNESPPARSALTVAEIASRWHEILAVSESASAEQIDEAYHQRIGECDRIRFSATEAPESKKVAELTRSQVNQAYEFIRPLREQGHA